MKRLQLALVVSTLCLPIHAFAGGATEHPCPLPEAGVSLRGEKMQSCELVISMAASLYCLDGDDRLHKARCENLDRGKPGNHWENFSCELDANTVAKVSLDEKEACTLSLAAKPKLQSSEFTPNAPTEDLSGTMGAQ